MRPDHVFRLTALGFTFREAASIWCATDLVADAVNHGTISFDAQLEILEMIYREGAKVLDARGVA